MRVSRVKAAAREWSRPRVRRYGRQASLKATVEFAGRSVRWLRFLGRLEEPTKVRHPHSAEVAAYAAWMRGERGLSEATVRGCCVAADEFFNWLAASDIPLASVTITDIDQANAAKNARKAYSRVTIRTHAQRLRAFFRFAENQRWCTPGLAAAIIPPRVYRDETVPAGLSRDDVLRLLATTEGDRPVDTRDRAILMLFATYGLRCGEVAGLQLDDLDWEEETLRVPSQQVRANPSLPHVAWCRAGHCSLCTRGPPCAPGNVPSSSRFAPRSGRLAEVHFTKSSAVA